jgi:hypothetical protein
VLLSLVVATIGLGLSPLAGAQELASFITRSGDKLMDGEKEYRFIGFNIPNLQMVEDNYALGAKSPWRLPDEFELTDALESVRQMGGTVVRTYVLSVRRAGSDMGDDVYVRGPGEFNEEAFRALDLALDVARKKGVRLIIPLVDNWKWQGGREEYASFHGKTPDEFWTDDEIFADFAKTVRFVVNRVNSRSGVPYKDDPAILCWETGNELDSTPEWTSRVAKLIKELDKNHLVMDGYSLHGVRQESLDDPNIDIVTTHHYPNVYEAKFVEPIVEARKKCAGKKPYVVGEFGFCSLAEIERVYDAVIQSGVSGALIWSLRFHNRDGGFYWHFEPAGGAKYKAYHWPGFETGAGYEEKAVLDLTRRKAFEIRGLAAPAIEPPAAPKLLDIADAASISWQGSAGAREYAVERTEDVSSGPWVQVGPWLDDATVQYRPLFNDESAEPGKSYFYRVAARNEAGKSASSAAVGPVVIRHRTLVDEGQDLSRLASHEGEVKATTGLDRRRGEDVHRLSIPTGAKVTYETAGPIASWSVITFHEQPGAALTAEYSVDGKVFTPAELRTTALVKDPGDYGYLMSEKLDSAGTPASARFLRLTAVGGEVELGRVEVRSK